MWQSDFSPNKMNRDNASDLTDLMKRSAWAFKFGDLGGKGKRLTPASSSSFLNAVQYLVSRLRIPRISATQSTGMLPGNPWEYCHPVQRIVATQSTGLLPPSERSDARAYE